MSFFDRSLVRPGSDFVGLENFRVVWEDDFLKIFWTTMKFSVGSTLLPFLLALAVALTLNMPIKGRGFLRSALIVPWIMPAVVVSFLWAWMLNANFGLFNGILRSLGMISASITFLGHPNLAMLSIVMAKTWTTFPWMAVMLLAGLQTVPSDLREAARVDGAGGWTTFRYVVLPHLRPIIGVVLLLEFIWNFQHFDIIYVLTGGGPAGTTRTFSVAVFQQAFEAFDLGRAAALGSMWMLILAVLIVVYVRMAERDQF